MKRILYLSFYFEPDLCAGSFRNSPLAKTLAANVKDKTEVEVLTTMPNRYATYSVEVSTREQRDNLFIQRIAIPTHKSGMFDQVMSFVVFAFEVVKRTKNTPYDLVFASSSRLFTAWLGAQIARSRKIPLYLDIRDLFVDTIGDVVRQAWYKPMLLGWLRRIERSTFLRASHINLISEGFKPYFSTYLKPGSKTTFSNYTNGIDDVILDYPKLVKAKPPSRKIKIVYAGNIGEGQGLHCILPDVASRMGDAIQITVIGDGGARPQLERALYSQGLHNIELLKPIARDQLYRYYDESDFLLLHLNAYDAFLKVLPSKLFELAAWPKPILAGVSGYARSFITAEVPGSYVFDPCDAQAMARIIENAEGSLSFDRSEFLAKYRRTAINEAMSKSIMALLK
jgi:hypothetical protein